MSLTFTYSHAWPFNFKTHSDTKTPTLCNNCDFEHSFVLNDSSPHSLSKTLLTRMNFYNYFYICGHRYIFSTLKLVTLVTHTKPIAFISVMMHSPNPA